MRGKVSVAALAVLLVLTGFLVGGGYVVKRRSEMVCGICSRPINAKATVTAEIGGRRQRVCCAHCAINEGLQEHKPVRLIEVTDYNSGRKLDPRQAWYVEGSRIVVCTHDMARMNEMKQAERMAFDRCSPGTFAFATRAAAEAFATENGGGVRNVDEILAAVSEVRP